MMLIFSRLWAFRRMYVVDFCEFQFSGSAFCTAKCTAWKFTEILVLILCRWNLYFCWISLISLTSVLSWGICFFLR